MRKLAISVLVAGLILSFSSLAGQCPDKPEVGQITIDGVFADLRIFVGSTREPGRWISTTINNNSFGCNYENDVHATIYPKLGLTFGLVNPNLWRDRGTCNASISACSVCYVGIGGVRGTCTPA